MRKVIDYAEKKRLEAMGRKLALFILGAPVVWGVVWMLLRRFFGLGPLDALVLVIGVVLLKRLWVIL